MADAHSIGYIYVITNTVNGKQYVGQTTKSIAKRWRAHLQAARAGKGSPALTAAIAKYGETAFSIRPYELPLYSTQAELDEAERAAIATCRSFGCRGYNLTTGGDGGGQRLHPESRAKLSASLRGRRFSAETIERLRVSHLGQERTPETRAKISASMKGIKRTPEHQRKLTEAGRGKPRSEGQLKALRKMWAAKPAHVSSETREKLRIKSTGRFYSPATREKLRAAKQQWWNDKKGKTPA